MPPKWCRDGCNARFGCAVRLLAYATVQRLFGVSRKKDSWRRTALLSLYTLLVSCSLRYLLIEGKWESVCRIGIGSV